MTFRWKRENITFESLHEADVWADSIGNEIYARLYDGYDTPDFKIAYSLAFRLASMKDFKIYAETVLEGEERYKVWVKPVEQSYT